MHKLCEVRDVIEAQILRDRLGAQSIEAVVFGGYLSGAAGELPVDLYPSVWILHEADLRRARDLLHSLQKPSVPDDAAESWACEGCGETVEGQFDLCWNCGASRPR